MINRSCPLLIVLIIIQSAILFSSVNPSMIIYNNKVKVIQITHIASVSFEISQENMNSDIIAPIITRPADISYLVNTTGHNISWYIADKNPSNYSILHNYRYIDTERNKTWSENQTISLSIDNLPIGIHLFSIIVEDLGHNTVSDDVVVMVLEKANFPAFTVTNTNADGLVELVEEYIIFGLGLSVLVLASVVLIGRSRYRKRFDLRLRLPPEDPLHSW